jgi:hypothetical protein
MLNSRTWILIWLAASLGLAVFGLIVGEGLTIGIVALLPLVLLSVALVRHFERKNDGTSLLSIFLIALTVRWVVAAIVHFAIYPSRPGLFAPDENYYDWAGMYVADYLHGRVPDPSPDIYTPGVVWIGAACYYVFDHAPMLPKLVNCLGGAWTAVLTALIAARIYPSAVARRAGILAAVFPSLVLWSVLNIKDCSTLLGAEIALLVFLHMRERFRIWLAALFVLSLLYISTNRAYEILFIAGSVGASFFFTSMKHLLRNLLLFSAMAILLLAVARKTDADTIPGSENQTTFERVSAARSSYVMDTGSAINVDLVDTSTPAGLALWLPIGLAAFYLAPVPFTGTSVISIATSPEMLLWYFLLPSLFRGLREALRNRIRAIAPVMLYVLISSIGWSLVVTNVGTLYRYRSQVMFVPLILIAADQVRRRSVVRSAAFPTLPVPTEGKA